MIDITIFKKRFPGIDPEKSKLGSHGEVLNLREFSPRCLNRSISRLERIDFAITMYSKEVYQTKFRFPGLGR